MGYSTAAAAMQFPAFIGLCNKNSNRRGSSHLFSAKIYLSCLKGITLYPTVDMLAAAGHRLRWIKPCMISIQRKNVQLIQVWKAELEESSTEKELEEPNIRKANLFAKRSERISLPIYKDSIGMPQPISSFFSHPSGTTSMLNTSALQEFECLGPNTYRCTLPKIEFLNFEVAPILDLRVTTTPEDCTVEMLSCRIGGNKTLESQNDRFSANAKNYITWNTECEEQFLHVNVELNVTLEVYTLPFSLLPSSVVERPGNIIMQTLLDRLVPVFLEQLLEDYRNWVQMDTFDSDREELFSSTKSIIKLDEP